MSQSRPRNVPVASGGIGPGPSVSTAKSGVPAAKSGVQASRASMDTLLNPVPRQQHQRSSSKNKLPKNIRYDLENALVGLCDVWFEDIKPYLIRNNIKLHIHGSPGPASGDNERIPADAPGCNHLDPGAASHQHQRSDASYANCYSTQRTVSTAPCPRPRARQPYHHLSPPVSLQPLPAHKNPQSKNRGCNGNSKRSPARRSRRSQPESSKWRVPSLRRTHSNLSPKCIPRNQTRSSHITLPMTDNRHDAYFQLVKPRQIQRKVKMKNKSTQTEWPSRRRKPAACPRKIIIPPRPRSPEVKCRQTRSKPLFSKDLVNIIAEKHDNKVRLLYKSLLGQERLSVINLIQPHKEKPIKGTIIKKKKPWR